MIRLIAAIDERRGIAKQGFQPWNLPQDEAYFSRRTKSHGAAVLLGSKTFQTALKRQPLSGRQNFLLTSDRALLAGVQAVHDLNAFLDSYKHGRDIWVIGGESIYMQVMEVGLADELYLTTIFADFGCDQFFPVYDNGKYQRIEQSDLKEQHGFAFRYEVWRRVINSADS